ncbi:MAG: hypothetical protein ABIQ60_15910, partial [Burkholderiaceae bacterium]
MRHAPELRFSGRQAEAPRAWRALSAAGCGDQGHVLGAAARWQLRQQQFQIFRPQVADQRRIGGQDR